MNIIFKYIEMRNFYSFGNVVQKVELDSSPLTLVLGQNNDASGAENSDSARNGVGKSAMIQAINFGLYGKSVGNKVKVSNLVNKTNKKNCEVTIAFEKDGIPYRIERKRNPTSLSLYIDDIDIESLDDEARGEAKDTQEEITDILGMPQEMFNQIVTLSTSVEPFLGQGPSKQRELIEQLLGITQLSEKASVLKDLIKQTKSSITNEEFKLDTVTKSNEKVQTSIKHLESQSVKWDRDTEDGIVECKSNLSLLSSVDIDLEITNQHLAEEARKHNNKLDDLKDQVQSYKEHIDSWEKDKETSLSNLQHKYDILCEIDIEDELAKHKELNVYNEESRKINDAIQRYEFVKKDAVRVKRDVTRHKAQLDKYQSQLDIAFESKCHTCGQVLTDEDHTAIISDLENKLNSTKTNVNDSEAEYKDLQEKMQHISDYEIYDLGEKPTVHYVDITQAYEHDSKLKRLSEKINETYVMACPMNSALERVQDEISNFVEHEVPLTVYDTVAEAYEHKNMVQALTSELETLEAQCNPYVDQIKSLKADSLQKVDYEEVNRLRKLQEHQDFLVRLLTNKDSFVRKRIIEQNIQFLNQRLTHYIDKCGSEHKVTFINDLSVEIDKMGENFDFESLSRGEKCRVIISLALAFRDTYESLYGANNLLLVDELFDSGTDPAGIEACYKIIKEMSRNRHKNIYVISHREELIARSEKTMLIVKENGFSSIEIDEE
ncbi:coil containing protein [Vibrio phage 2.275.O._10N.286.54.E11]|nr:coil containing protein [Vibrio phage 2.275.O._10N.286.54.E11]